MLNIFSSDKALSKNDWMKYFKSMNTSESLILTNFTTQPDRSISLLKNFKSYKSLYDVLPYCKANPNVHDSMIIEMLAVFTESDYSFIFLCNDNTLYEWVNPNTKSMWNKKRDLKLEEIYKANLDFVLKKKPILIGKKKTSSKPDFHLSKHVCKYLISSKKEEKSKGLYTMISSVY